MLQKLLQLAKEEGGKAFVMNQTTGEVFCIMPLETYREMKRSTTTVVQSTPSGSLESIASLSEEELLRKINREIAIWRDQQKDKAEIILPSREERGGVPEIKKFAKDFPKIDSAAVILRHQSKDLEQPSINVAKAPILETEEEFFLEMA